MTVVGVVVVGGEGGWIGDSLLRDRRRLVRFGGMGTGGGFVCLCGLGGRDGDGMGCKEVMRDVGCVA
jgi:hypothetical protein